MTYETIMAGFGGQGLLFSGKVLAHAALIENKELSWLPSYGPEMRGGTCNCSVIVSDDPVGSPIIAHPNVLMVMNEPSLDKFEDTVAPGGTIFVDSALIGRKVRRADVEVVYIPATQMAKDMDALSLANMIILGAIVEKLRCVDPDKIEQALVADPAFDPAALPIIRCDDLESATLAAREMATFGDTVILSPACASFDAFPNFEVRGNTFKQIVMSW